jgi:hypothetical protein
VGRDSRVTDDLFVGRADAYQALKDALRDEPNWRALLGVAPMELAGKWSSPNYSSAN